MIWLNENNPHAAQWLRNLIEQGHLPDGRVDDRSMLAVRPADLDADQCHFFAGIGGWPHALALAGWPRARPVWTASLPCQPLSVAGQQRGHVDERHLWPAFHRLVAERRPATILGEQVASKDGREWMAAVRHDLEGDGYAVGTAVLPAAGFGAPHIRYRMFFVAYAGRGTGERDARGVLGPQAEVRREDGPLDGHLPERHSDGGADGRMADAERDGRQRLLGDDGDSRAGSGSKGQLDEQPAASGACGRPSPPHSFWRDADWIFCRDHKWRPVEPGTFPLAHGVPGRVGRLRAYGNSIVPQVAAEFIKAYLEEHPS